MSKVLASSDFYQNIRPLIEQSRRKTAAAVNFLMIETYWHIGKIIVEEEQQGSYRAAYGDQIDTETCSATFQRVQQRLQSSEPLADAAVFPDVPNSRRSAARILPLLASSPTISVAMRCYASARTPPGGWRSRQQRQKCRKLTKIKQQH